MASPFASHTQSDRIPLPFDPPHTITVRKLTGFEVEHAQEAHRSNFGSPRSWAVTFRRMLEAGSASDAEVRTAIADPLTGYDRYALVRAGLVSWSYPQSVKPIAATPAINGKPAVEASDAIADLDDEAVDFIAREVLRLTKPALFLTTEEEVDAAQKNVPAAASVA
jgi:hypothetical protein